VRITKVADVGVLGIWLITNTQDKFYPSSSPLSGLAHHEISMISMSLFSVSSYN
jgi:hypothetical protein